MVNHKVSIFSDGSCHTQLKVGAWSAIIFINFEKYIIKGVEENTTHNNMEIKAVNEALIFIIEKLNSPFDIIVYTDSQLVERIPQRALKFKKSNFLTKKGTKIRNIESIKKLISFIESYPIKIQKVKAHLKATDKINYNREVDILVRKTLREYITNRL